MKKEKNSELKKLIYLEDMVQKNFIMDVLIQKGIIPIIKPNGLDSILGYTTLGEELYVKETDYEWAQMVLQVLDAQKVDQDKLEKIAVSDIFEEVYVIETDYEEALKALNEFETQKAYQDMLENMESVYIEENKTHCLSKIIFLFAVVSAITVIYNYYPHFGSIVKWHDDTIGWIVSQEMNTPTEGVIASEVPDFAVLELDAETIRNIKDLKFFTNLQDLTLNVKNIKSLDILRRLDNLDRLVLINGNMDTLKYIKELNISQLVLKDFTLSSLEFLNDIDNLVKLEIENTYIGDASSLSDLSSLSYLSLVNVRSDEPIYLSETCNYKDVYLSNVEISNLDILSRCKNLISLKLENINLDPSVELVLSTSLNKLTVKHCGLINLNMFLALPHLTSLDVSGNEIQNISDLAVFNDLKELSLAHNPVHDLSPIMYLKGFIKLNLSGIKLDKKTIDLLSKMQFEELSVSNCNITDLNFLAGKYEIKRLDVSDNAIENIEILNMYRKNLKYLNISGNPISDLSPLMEWAPNIPSLYKEDPLFEGVELDVSGINLGEIDFEKGISVIRNSILSKLTARNCGLKDVELARFQIALEFLDVSGNPIESISPLNELKILEDVIAKDTLITESQLPNRTKLLTQPGTYGVASLWKMPNYTGHLLIDTDKMRWIRFVIE